jgi:hypothetical protein
MYYIIIGAVILIGLIFVKNGFKNKNVDLKSSMDKWEDLFLTKGFTFKPIINPTTIKVSDLFEQFGSVNNRRCIDIGGNLLPFSFGYKDTWGVLIESKPLSIEIIDKLYSTILKAEELKENLIKEHGVEKANALINKKYVIGQTTIDDITSIRGVCLKVKTEQLKTKTKTTLYYGYTKNDDFYIFDGDVLVKFVDKIL